MAVPPFLERASLPLARSGRHLRLLAAMPQSVVGDLALQLVASAEAECKTAAAAAAASEAAGSRGVLYSQNSFSAHSLSEYSRQANNLSYSKTRALHLLHVRQASERTSLRERSALFLPSWP